MNDDSTFRLKDSTLYKRWAEEKRQIELHKWYLSEKAGYDVGFEYAHYNWVMLGYKRKWLDSYLKENSVY